MPVVFDAKTCMLQSVVEFVGLAMYLDMACDIHGEVTIKSTSYFQ